MKLPGFSKKPAPAPPLPEIEEPAVMPDPDDQGLKVRKRRKAAQRSMRSGRASTDHTSMPTTLG